jgi:DNA-directed RNA polymerase subunit beta'
MLANEILLEWDPYTFSIPTEGSGTIHFKDRSEGPTLQKQADEITGISQRVVTADAVDEKPKRAARRNPVRRVAT